MSKQTYVLVIWILYSKQIVPEISRGYLFSISSIGSVFVQGGMLSYNQDKMKVFRYNQKQI